MTDLRQVVVQTVARNPPDWRRMSIEVEPDSGSPRPWLGVGLDRFAMNEGCHLNTMSRFHGSIRPN
jgi:hypothetical protein